MSRPVRVDRSGFTLVEVLVATIVTATVVTLVTQTISVTGDTLRRVEEHAETHHEAMMSMRWLQQTLPTIDLRGSGRFDGSARTVSFPVVSWSADGWLEPSTVQVTAGEQGLTVQLSGIALSVFQEHRVRIEYLVPSGDRQEWVSVWNSSVTPPRAIRFVFSDPETAEPKGSWMSVLGAV